MKNRKKNKPLQYQIDRGFLLLMKKTISRRASFVKWFYSRLS